MPTTSSPPISDPQPWTLPGARPRFATPRNPSAYTEGDQVAVVAKVLGTPLIPWQEHVASVAGERRPDGSYEYEVVVVTVPRQCGKTTLLRAVGTQRALAGRSVFYTAQTGKDARARWYELVELLRVNEALKERVKIALRGGSEHVRFPSGAVFQCFAPTPESLHGYRPPTVMVDEAFAQTGGKGELLMGAFGPAQFTIIDRQIWIVSTAGTAESTWLHDWIEKAMEGSPRVALFDWGARDDQSPYDLEQIADFHPGVGFTLDGKTLTPGDVLQELNKNTRAEYERAFANRRTLTLSHLIPVDTWRALARNRDLAAPKLDLSKCVLAYDVAHDRQSASIMALWEDAGTPCGMVLRSEPGTAWLAPAVDQLARDGRPLELAAVDSGPALDTTAQLRLLGREPRSLSEKEFTTATGALLARIDDQAFTWYASDRDAATLLERSVTGLATRPTGDGVVFSRRLSVGDSSAGIGFAAGLHVLTNRAKSAPRVYFGKTA